jgi:HupE / UreJ protein
MRHIAEGTDHLLFLMALILPAPLVAAGWRWGGYAGGRAALRRTFKVVTAFTLGHSITLVLGALGWARLPDALVESVIALSILISAVHALIPIFRGREVFIVGGFGLMHGLAFASTLTGFGLDPLTLASSVLGFNLGIEAFQLLIILAMTPWLVLLARSRVYGPFRIAVGSLTGVAAAAWFAERAFGPANPIAPLVEGAASHAPWLMASLVVLTCIASIWMRFGRGAAGCPSTRRSGSRSSTRLAGWVLTRLSTSLR